MKIQKQLLKPVNNWVEIYGMKRAIKVLELQAAMHRENGDSRSAFVLRDVSIALKASINKESPVAESVTLKWADDEVTP